MDKVCASFEIDRFTLLSAYKDFFVSHCRFRAAWIQLQVHSALDSVGLTAAFSKTLGDAGISCNVVAGYFHDHLFVEYDKRDAAMTELTQLQKRSCIQRDSAKKLATEFAMIQECL